jgi:hypothetical protein
MAVKKTAKKKEASAVPTKVEAKETAPKKAPKKAAAKAPAAEPTPAPAPVVTPAPAPVAKKAAPKKAAAAVPKKAAAAPIKLSASQVELLKKIGETSETGYTVAKKVEQRSVDSLLEKKLIKKGAKDKGTGLIKYHISSAGKKHTS